MSSKLEFWQYVQPKPGEGDLAIESSKLEFWPWVQPKPGAGDLAIKPSKLQCLLFITYGVGRYCQLSSVFFSETIANESKDRVGSKRGLLSQRCVGPTSGA